MFYFLNGLKVVEERISNTGILFTFFDRDNEISYSLTELNRKEFKEFSSNLDDFSRYDEIKQYTFESITGLDWDIKKGQARPNLIRIFKTIELIGKAYTTTCYPDMLYYAYENKKMHKHYSKWMFDVGYEKVYDDNGVAFFYRGRDEIQQQNNR